MKEKISKIKWEVLITIIISFTSVFVAVKANNISKMQTLIAKNSALPTIEVNEKVVENTWFPGGETSIIEISNLSGKLNNYASDVVSFLHCGYFGEETGPYETMDIPLENYYIMGEKNGVVTGVIEKKSALNNYDRVQALRKDILQFNKENEDGKSIEANVQTFLKISYLDLLNEEQVVYYMVDPIAVKIIKPDYGQSQFEKYREMTGDGYGINPNGVNKILVEDVLDNITRVISNDKADGYEGINQSEIESRVEKVYDSWIINFICAIIGGSFTLIGGVGVHWKEKKSQQSHAASILYYDLKSIENYLAHERSSVNLRYSEDWQSMVAGCSFLKDKYIEWLYNLYDEVYNYDYHYRLLEKQGSVTKEDIKTYELLKKKLFDDSKDYIDFNVHKDEYEELLKELKKAI